MNQQDIRWKQRFHNYIKAFSKLEEAIQNIKEKYSLVR